MRTMWPFRHFGLKLTSVGLAILLWMTVSGEETVERGLEAGELRARLRSLLLGRQAGPARREARVQYS